MSFVSTRLNDKLVKSMKIEMRLASPLAVLALVAASQAPHAQEVFKAWEDRTQVEFYIAGRLQPPPRYRVKSFRRVGKDAPELAGRFHGLAAQNLENGEYEYALEPETAPPGPPGVFTLVGKVQLHGPFPYWITLQMPTGSLADGAYFMITGRVVPPPAAEKEPVWLRFQHAVDHSQVVQMKLVGDGTFRIPFGPLTGSVVVTVCRGADVLFLDVVHFSGGRPDRPLDLRLRTDPM